MLNKSFIIFGLLALFACQGTSANQYEIQTFGLSDLIDEVRQIIASLNELVTGTIADALSTLTNLVKTVAEIKTKFLDEGIILIKDTLGEVITFMAEKSAEAAQLGIDITACIVGRNEQVQDMTVELTEKLSICITGTVSRVLETINNQIKNINKIVASITAAPLRLSKCLISLRPITCVTNLLKDLKDMLVNLPGQIKAIVDESNQLVKDLPAMLIACNDQIVSTAREYSEQMINEIGTCVDDAISEGTVTEASIARASLGDLIDQVKEIISSLNNLVSGVIGDALGTLTNLISTINEIKTKFLDEGIAVIKESISNVVNYIRDVTVQAAELGIDISKCIAGRQDEVQDLEIALIRNVTDCVTDAAVEVLKMVNADIVIVNDIISSITAAPVKLAKCLVTLRPITCVSNLLKDLTNILTTTPGKILEIVKNATNLVQTLPVQMAGCVEDIGKASAEETAQIISEIGTCVDDVIAEEGAQKGFAQ